MRTFIDSAGDNWTASAREEETPRHHSRWYLVFHPTDDPNTILPMHEVRWQTKETAERTIRTLSERELLRRLRVVTARTPHATLEGSATA